MKRVGYAVDIVMCLALGGYAIGIASGNCTPSRSVIVIAFLLLAVLFGFRAFDE